MPYKVLVVDDEPDLETLVRQKFRKRIRDGEFEFHFARNGQEALDKLQEDSGIDVVMSDINMPVMDGLTLLSRLADVDRILKAVIVSAYGDMQNIRTAMNRGAYDFLTKPIDFDDFEATMTKTIREMEAIKQGLKARQELSAIQSELSVASRIQQSILPQEFPPFPGRREFDLHAQMIAAKDVGGDFYDFFLIDDDRLGFVIGDVSGKGVPAAIFMAVSRTLVKATALGAASPAACLAYVNRVLESQRVVGMFVTIFYGILNTATGDVEYGIAGHNPGMIISTNGQLSSVDIPRSVPAGLFAKAEYENGRVGLKPGETLFLYTDGVTEAMDPADIEFGSPRLEAVLGATAGKAPEEVTASVIAAVRQFTAGTAQSDDITCLALRFNGRR